MAHNPEKTFFVLMQFIQVDDKGSSVGTAWSDACSLNYTPGTQRPWPTSIPISITDFRDEILPRTIEEHFDFGIDKRVSGGRELSIYKVVVIWDQGSAQSRLSPMHLIGPGGSVSDEKFKEVVELMAQRGCGDIVEVAYFDSQVESWGR